MNCSYAPSHPPPKKGMSTKRTENKSRHDSRQTFTQWNHRGPTLSHGTDLTHVRLYQPRGSDWFWILAIARKRNLILSTVPFEKKGRIALSSRASFSASWQLIRALERWKKSDPSRNKREKWKEEIVPTAPSQISVGRLLRRSIVALNGALTGIDKTPGFWLLRGGEARVSRADQVHGCPKRE